MYTPIVNKRKIPEHVATTHIIPASQPAATESHRTPRRLPSCAAEAVESSEEGRGRDDDDDDDGRRRSRRRSETRGMRIHMMGGGDCGAPPAAAISCERCILLSATDRR